MKKINNNIGESYCSFEVSKLLKEKGFDVTLSAQYWERNDNKLFLITPFEEEFISLNHEDASPNDMQLICGAPTHALAIEWIRVNFGIQLFLDYTYHDGFRYGYKWVKNNGDYGEFWKDNDSDPSGWDSPQEATEAALLYTLKNLIK